MDVYRFLEVASKFFASLSKLCIIEEEYNLALALFLQV
jgi:hypothetical protein